ncbi:hypothetical protein HPT25_16465 [Bacillus sp. BRMEA1]|uniref:hypothetical protein n=1 Tax=Neobacillus endophyticus TaxID=2738405 RepID=UPI0015654A7A|nr:hypothetical protein [Neobacillus endophyticus]NRD78959.1 hypothetical protein [Neobacillus endophyticus]
MKKRLLTFIAAAFIFALATPLHSFAAYDSSSDSTINVNVLNSNTQPAVNTGETTFQLQEGVHQTLTGMTGTDLDHSYIWVNVNGQNILAIDPIKPSF